MYRNLFGLAFVVIAIMVFAGGQTHRLLDHIQRPGNRHVIRTLKLRLWGLHGGRHTHGVEE